MRPAPRRTVRAAALLTLASACVRAGAATYFVPQDFPTIQAAINACAPTGDSVIIMSGTYHENIDTLGKFVGISGVAFNPPTLIGNPGAPAIIVRNAGGFLPIQVSNLTIRDCDALLGGGISVYAGANLWLRNSRLWHNNAVGGGAIFVSTDATLKVTGCDVWDNSAESQGGAIYALSGSHTTIEDTLFEANTAVDSGGAIRVYAGEIDTNAGVRFLNNDAGDVGGAIEALSDSLIYLNAVSFTGNHTNVQGGAVYADNSLVVSEGCLYILNDADGSGGAVALAADAQFNSVTDTFDDNHADLSGGAVRNLESRFYANRSEFTDNTCANFGGGVSVASSAAPASTRLYNCRLLRNHANFGAALRVDTAITGTPSAYALVANCLVAQNASNVSFGSGGLDAFESSLAGVQTTLEVIGSTVVSNTTGADNGVRGSGAPQINVFNSILWNNTGSNLSNSVTRTNATFSIFPEAGSYPGVGNITSNPRFTNLASGVYTLDAGSPAIDSGDNLLIPTDALDDDDDTNTVERLPRDLAGFARVSNDPLTPDTGIGAGGPSTDIGCYEFPRTCAADQAAPYGTLNFFDTSAFLAAYSAHQPQADLAAPAGSWDFFDVSAFLALYNGGCP